MANKILFWVISLSLVLAPWSVSGQTLSAQITANPSSGEAPLSGVGLSAVVSGTASGPITYKFDCTGDGSWELIETSNNTSFTAHRLCNYSSPGSYTAKIEVIRGGLAFLGSTAVLVRSGSSLSVALSANPSSGQAPLNGVDLTATVSGSATGNITYRFDCSGDGSYERTETTDRTFFTAQDVCNYPDPGSYSAKVLVQRGELSFQGNATVNVTSQAAVSDGAVILKVEKLARNITKGQTGFSGSLVANPGDRIEFQVKVRSLGKAEARNVQVKDALPPSLFWRDNVKIDGASSNENIVTGLTLAGIAPGQSKTITFETELAPAEQFKAGSTNLINTAFAFNDRASTSTAFKLTVNKGAPTLIATGVIDQGLTAVLLTLLLLFGISYFYLAKHYWSSKLLPLAFKTKRERDLARAIERAKQRRSQG